MVARQTPNLEVGVQVLYGLPKKDLTIGYKFVIMVHVRLREKRFSMELLRQ
tara:strand:+ start:50 stop:202 length:153 start_codon:yes stop_codon:yes gene_type:complete